MKNFRREIFEHLGGLFYAIATEQHTPVITSGELKMAIRQDWLSDADAQQVSEAAHLMGVTIDQLQTEQRPALEAFDAFERFYRTHEEQFSQALRRQIVETADTIMRILPSSTKRNEYYDRLKELLYVLQ